MLTPTQFTEIMDDVIRTHFPTTRLAYAEKKEEVINNLYAGKAEEYVSRPDPDTADQSGEGEFPFVDIVMAVAPVVSILTVVKLAAESYIAIQKAFTKNKQDPASALPPPHIDEETLRENLSHRLRRYLPKEQAAKIAEQVAQKVETSPTA